MLTDISKRNHKHSKLLTNLNTYANIANILVLGEPLTKEHTLSSSTRTRAATLVLSWSGLLRQLYDRSLTFDELEGALFYFSCTRDHVFSDGVGDSSGEMQSYYVDDAVRCAAIYATLCQALIQAEAEGRVAWREGCINSFEQLNQLLEINGLTPFAQPGSMEDRSYCRPNVLQAASEQDLPYRIIGSLRS